MSKVAICVHEIRSFGGQFTALDIARATNTSEKDAQNAIAKLRKDNSVVHVGYGPPHPKNGAVMRLWAFKEAY